MTIEERDEKLNAIEAAKQHVDLAVAALEVSFSDDPYVQRYMINHLRGIIESPNRYEVDLTNLAETVLKEYDEQFEDDMPD